MRDTAVGMELNQAERRVPTRFESIVFRAKTTVLQAKRAVEDLVARDGRIRRYQRSDSHSEVPAGVLLSEVRSPLWRALDDDISERGLAWGKVHNLRRALRSFDGVVVPAGGIVSFWKQMGRATHVRGYVPGRELREGCLIPAIGGGLCQLSNVLYEAALTAGLKIVERHAHSRIVPGSAAAAGRDATVFWNYVDLRWRAPIDAALRISARMTANELIISFRAERAKAAGLAPVRAPASESFQILDAHGNNSDNNAASSLPIPNSCMTCGIETCHRHGTTMASEARAAAGRLSQEHGRTAFVVDEAWPEFLDYIRETRSPASEDVIIAPRIQGAPAAAISGIRGGIRNHAERTLLRAAETALRKQQKVDWSAKGFGSALDDPFGATLRGFAVRRAVRAGRNRGATGDSTTIAAWREAHLNATHHLVRRLIARGGIPFDATRAVVAQSLLPFLWREGELGGRRFDVLMTRLPLSALHEQLDAAAAAFPDRATLADFRAPAWMIDAESEALQSAERIITPHPAVAALFPDRAMLLDWKPPTKALHGCIFDPAAETLLFPGPTAARRGAYEVRDAALALGMKVVIPETASELEGKDFWRGCDVRRIATETLFTDATTPIRIIAAALPAIAADRPPDLLFAAIAAGIPVIAAPSVGLSDREATFIPPLSSDTLKAAIEAIRAPSVEACEIAS